MKTILSLCLLLLFFQVEAQVPPQKARIKINLTDLQRDTLGPVSFDANLPRANSPAFSGTFNANQASLPQNPPTQNVFANTQFARKTPAADLFQVNEYPLRAAVKTFVLQEDTLVPNCSGIMVSNRHVLTAAHCHFDLINDTLYNPHILVAPAFDRGSLHPTFDTLQAKTLYFFENWDVLGEDFALLELAGPIGIQTGWIGMGFERVDSLLLDGIYHKFSYPNEHLPFLDPKVYNGDTLYYSYGVADDAQPKSIGIFNTNGIPGESGSSLFKLSPDGDFATYGVLTFSGSLRHSRITNWIYHAFEDLIQDDLTVDRPEPVASSQWQLFPNPTSGWLYLRGLETVSRGDWTLFNAQGQIVLECSQCALDQGIDFSGLPNGIYHLQIQTGDVPLTQKVIKIQP